MKITLKNTKVRGGISKNPVVIPKSALLPLLQFLHDHEQWEADLINCDEAWENGNPKMTDEIYEQFLVLQDKRNKALSNFIIEENE